MNERTTPVLDGLTYCSPRCGFRCTRRAFDRATTEAAHLAHRLGPDWTPRVWENCGWHYEVSMLDGLVEVKPDLAVGGGTISGNWKVEGYSCWIQMDPQFIERARTPEDAINKAKSRLYVYMARAELLHSKLRAAFERSLPALSHSGRTAMTSDRVFKGIRTVPDTHLERLRTKHRRAREQKATATTSDRDEIERECTHGTWESRIALIRRLEKERDEARAQIEALTAKLEKAREALEPFAKAFANRYPDPLDECLEPVWNGHLRAAAQTLAELEKA